MKTCIWMAAAALLTVAGCKTTETTTPLSWGQQQAYLARVRDPRVFHLGIYQTPAGVEYRGGRRLHPHQTEALKFQVEEPLRPVVMIRAKSGREHPVLLDFTASRTWFEFGLAQAIGAVPVGENNQPNLLRHPLDEEIASCQAVVPYMRFRQLHIERSLVYVRFAEGPLGPMARGIEEPMVEGIIGWDLLNKFGQIRFDYSMGMLALATDDEDYTPNPARLEAALPLVKHAGACAVRARVNDQETLVLIDPAGDFEVAAEEGTVVTALELGDLLIETPAVAESPGGVRVGARLLNNYQVTVCPQAGMLYFETMPEED